jgi:hypothetical protein
MPTDVIPPWKCFRTAIILEPGETGASSSELKAIGERLTSFTSWNWCDGAHFAARAYTRDVVKRTLREDTIGGC